MTVRAKFWVREKVENPHQTVVKLAAVCRGEDNKAWAAATPVGSIEMTVLNKVAADALVTGEEYFVDFTPAPKGEEGMG